MSDSDSSSWESEDEFSDELGVRPYIFDPQLGSDESPSGDDDGDAGDGPGHRMAEFDWCSCGNCFPMETELSCVCCKEQCGTEEKIEEASVQCITEHHLFQKHCLDRDIIELEEIKMRNSDHDTVRHKGNKVKRHIAYKQFVFWIYHRLGKGHRAVVPSCAVVKIRQAFPSEDGVYTGFKHAQ